ncbi:hypothetical protein EHF33_03170 [Deinococcus psychrotolerans]|uniref:Uncharacterized protein n=1 Tax=Deinococcus psychrotolerans TaxID=2489213 RepID=A0A3G8YHD9_9DEIO|nr:hypothetical protein [Deinococcus psychrotolerans]AZI41874.1 hypothetical protein EHF33_03170 [Deinococcus psychrotolerans]
MSDLDTAQRLSNIENNINAAARTLEKLDRAVSGDPESGTESMRKTIQQLSLRLEVMEKTAELQAARFGVVMLLFKWLGGTSLITVLTAVGLVLKFAGVKP